MSVARQLRPAGGFTLIEILVVLTIIAAIIGIAVPIYTSVQDNKNVTLCKSNLKSVGSSLTLYYQRFKHYPRTDKGGQFLLEVLRKKIVDYEEETIEKTVRNLLVCPGDDFANEAIAGRVWEVYGDLDNIEPDAISYAGRNTKDYPLRRKKAGSEIIACDAGGADGNEMTHRDKINILYLDQSVGDIDVVKLPDEDPKNFEVGPSSPLKALQKLNKDT